MWSYGDEDEKEDDVAFCCCCWENGNPRIVFVREFWVVSCLRIENVAFVFVLLLRRIENMFSKVCFGNGQRRTELTTRAGK